MEEVRRIERSVNVFIQITGMRWEYLVLYTYQIEMSMEDENRRHARRVMRESFRIFDSDKSGYI